MAVPAEWGFVPFATATDYPELPLEASQRESGGKRSQKTDFRRRQQLENLVAGVVQLPTSAAKAATASAAKRQAHKGERGADSQSEGSKVSATSTTSIKRRESQPSSRAAKSVNKQPATAENTEHAHAHIVGDQSGSKPARKRKAAAMQTSNNIEAETVFQTVGDRPLSRKQQKQKLRQQIYEARKQGPAVDQATAQPLQLDGDRDATHTSEAAPPTNGSAKTPVHQASGGSTEPVATTQPEQQSPTTPGSTLSRKQQKRLERQQRYTAQKAESAHSTEGDIQANESVCPEAASDGNADSTRTPKTKKRSTPHTDASKTPSGLIQTPKLPTNQHQLGSQEQAEPTAADKSSAKKRTKPDRLKAAGASGPKAASAGDVNGAPLLPVHSQSRASTSGNGASSGLLDKMRAKLQGGRFRWLNEELYSSTGNSAFDLMQGDPDLYDQYHEGFRRQAADWPQQPVDLAIAWLKAKPAGLVVADFGCGDAQIAAEVKQKVHSFDLVATVPGVTACNMAATPLEEASIDVAVFCLALMGTDYGAFLQEAHRVLKSKGWLWICEVRSRFAGQSDPSGPSVADGFSPDATAKAGAASSWVMVNFTKALQRLGFRLVQRKVLNKMFVVFELRKDTPKGKGSIEWPELKGCVYRKR